MPGLKVASLSGGIHVQSSSKDTVNISRRPCVILSLHRWKDSLGRYKAPSCFSHVDELLRTNDSPKITGSRVRWEQMTKCWFCSLYHSRGCRAPQHPNNASVCTHVPSPGTATAAPPQRVHCAVCSHESEVIIITWGVGRWPQSDSTMTFTAGTYFCILVWISYFDFIIK